MNTHESKNQGDRVKWSYSHTARAAKFKTLKALNACNCKAKLRINGAKQTVKSRKKLHKHIEEKRTRNAVDISDSTSLSWFDLFSLFFCNCYSSTAVVISLVHFPMCVCAWMLNKINIVWKIFRFFCSQNNSTWIHNRRQCSYDDCKSKHK